MFSVVFDFLGLNPDDGTPDTLCRPRVTGDIGEVPEASRDDVRDGNAEEEVILNHTVQTEEYPFFMPEERINRSLNCYCGVPQGAGDLLCPEDEAQSAPLVQSHPVFPEPWMEEVVDRRVQFMDDSNFGKPTAGAMAPTAINGMRSAPTPTRVRQMTPTRERPMTPTRRRQFAPLVASHGGTNACDADTDDDTIADEHWQPAEETTFSQDPDPFGSPEERKAFEQKKYRNWIESLAAKRKDTVEQETYHTWVNSLSTGAPSSQLSSADMTSASLIEDSPCVPDSQLSSADMTSASLIEDSPCVPDSKLSSADMPSAPLFDEFSVLSPSLKELHLRNSAL